jgi:GTP-binding protein
LNKEQHDFGVDYLHYRRDANAKQGVRCFQLASSFYAASDGKYGGDPADLCWLAGLIRKGAKKDMIIRSTEFVKSATKPVNYPPAGEPEVAFAGRSNVGKSSLINSLLNRRNLVRTSSTPGRTQLLNFFQVNQQFSLVDLPGYGFAKVPLAVKQAWGPMIRTYLEQRDSLRGVVFILDIRRVPGAEDLQMLDWLEEFEVPTILVVTKIDKIGRSQYQSHLRKIADATGLPVEAFSLFSAVNRYGVDEVWERIEDALDLDGGDGIQDADV